MTDIIDEIRQKGLGILAEIDVKEESAPRSFYSVSKVLLDVDEVETKKGKAGEQEIADALSKYGKAMRLPRTAILPPTEIDQLRKLIQVAEQKQAKLSKYQTVNPADIKDLAELIGKMLTIVLAVLAVYDRARKAKRPSKRNTKRSKSK